MAVPPLEYKADAARNMPYVILYNDGITYIGMANGLTVFDLSDAENPIILDEAYAPGNYSTDMKKYGDTIYITNGTGLYIYDVSNPRNIAEIGHYSTPAMAWGVDIQDTIACVSYNDYYTYAMLTILDISDLSNIIEISSDSLGESAHEIRIRNDTVYTNSDAQYVKIIDISDPVSPITVNKFTTGDYQYIPREITPKDTLLHIRDMALSWPTGDAAYSIYNIADVHNPVLVDRYELTSMGIGSIDFSANDSIVYVSAMEQGLLILDISDPADISLLGSFPAREATFGVAATGDTAYIIDVGPQDEKSLRDTEKSWDSAPAGYIGIIDISNPAEPAEIGNFVFSPPITNVYYLSGIVYALSNETGDSDVIAIQFSDAGEEPSVLGQYKTVSGYPADAVSIGDTLIIGCGGGLEMTDASDPSDLKYLRTYTTTGGVYDVAISGGYAFATAGGNVNIFYIHDAEDTLVSTILANQAVNLGIQDSILFVSDKFEGVFAYNVADPENPEFLSQFVYTLSVLDLAFIDSYIVVQTGYGLDIFDISDPKNPGFVTHWDNEQDWNYGLEIVGNCALVADVWEGLTVVDISDIENPVRIDRYNTPGSAYRTCSHGNDVFVADGNSVIQLTFTDPTGVEDEPAVLPQFSVSQNYPNPFNPTTTIEFTLERRSVVTIDIFDILGRKIRTLIDGQMGPGEHSVQWDGRDREGELVSTGVYFYRVITEDYAATRKMLFLK